MEIAVDDDDEEEEAEAVLEQADEDEEVEGMESRVTTEHASSFKLSC